MKDHDTCDESTCKVCCEHWDLDDHAVCLDCGDERIEHLMAAAEAVVNGDR